MKKRIKRFYKILVRRDKEIGICILDVLKYTLIAAAALGLLLLLTPRIGFAAAVAVMGLSAAVIAAGICFCTEQ